MKSRNFIAAALVVLAVGFGVHEAREVHQISQTQPGAAAVARLEAENAQLRKDLRAAQERSAAAQLDRSLVHGHAARAPEPAQAALAAGLTPVDQLSNVGRKNARDAFATQIWASSHGNIELAADAIAFTPAGRRILTDLEAKLPPNVAAQYDTPEKLMAFALAGSPHPVAGMEVLGETSIGDNSVELQVAWQHADDELVNHNTLNFQQDDQGNWRQILPTALVRRVAAYLAHGALASAAAK